MTEESVKNEETDASPLEKKIIRQIEYYFGDVNLPKDKFLNEKMQEDDKWITIECLTTFARLKQLSTDLDEIKNALKKSQSGLLEIHETEYKIRRSENHPLPDHDDPMIRKASKEKTLYMKGFPELFTIDDAQEFFDKQNIKTVFIKLRKDAEKKFKGSLFVEVGTLDEVKLLTDNKELKYGESSLTVMLRDDYFKSKSIEKKDSHKKDNAGHEEKFKLDIKPGAVLHFKGVGEETNREILKELFGQHHQIAWVDFEKGDTEGFIRFQDEHAAQNAIDSVKNANDEKKVIINGVESSVRVLEGEEEENYWKTLRLDLQKRKGVKNNRGRRNNRGGGGDRRGGGRDSKFQGKRKRPWVEKTDDNASTGESKENAEKTEKLSKLDSEN
ncbi:lupus La protein homolog A isoform X1 [Hydra vulgaris]|uniref:Lupus La protein n=1 Tax=Hydra vulgaris TaxID=6087 RepID=T2MGV5_HYDVU|nr:lupus La protein homolog A isoform X1 [Hydra vulgaris]XP_047139287.1 lupus La protein homolog A isoform X2 [Hydra vulgaris]